MGLHSESRDLVGLEPVRVPRFRLWLHTPNSLGPSWTLPWASQPQVPVGFFPFRFSCPHQNTSPHVAPSLPGQALPSCWSSAPEARFLPAIRSGSPSCLLFKDAPSPPGLLSRTHASACLLSFHHTLVAF